MAGTDPSGDPAAAHLAPPPRIPGYEEVRLHRQGSSAEVYRATSEGLGRTVAIKLLRLDELTTYQQFQQEIQTTIRLAAAPHVVPILDTGTVDGRPYLAMEFCEDGSYAEIVAAHGPLPVRDAVDVGIRVAEALHAAHQMGVIHRDVTPGNILRTGSGPALTDFGIARRPAELSGTVTLNKLTPHHAAPAALLRRPQSVARTSTASAPRCGICSLATRRSRRTGSPTPTRSSIGTGRWTAPRRWSRDPRCRSGCRPRSPGLWRNARQTATRTPPRSRRRCVAAGRAGTASRGDRQRPTLPLGRGPRARPFGAAHHVVRRGAAGAVGPGHHHGAAAGAAGADSTGRRHLVHGDHRDHREAVVGVIDRR